MAFESLEQAARPHYQDTQQEQPTSDNLRRCSWEIWEWMAWSWEGLSG